MKKHCKKPMDAASIIEFIKNDKKTEYLKLSRKDSMYVLR